MPHRLGVFLLVLGLTLPMLPLVTVRAGSLATAGDIAGPAEGGDAAAMRGLDVVRLWVSGNDWTLGDDRLPGTRVRLVPGAAMLPLEPGSLAQRSWAGVETLDVSLTRSLLVAESVVAAAPSNSSGGWGTGEPLARRTLSPGSSSGGAAPFMYCSLRHDDPGIAGSSAGIDAWRLCFFLVIASAAGAWVVWTRPMPATGSDRDASGLGVGNEAALESPGSKSTWVALDGETLDAMLDAQERNDLEEVAFLLARRRVIRIRNGTRVEVLRPQDTSIKVYIRNGPNRGVEAWVQREFVRGVRVMPGYDFPSFDSASHVAPSPGLGPKRGICSFFLAGRAKIKAQERCEDPDKSRALKGRTQAGEPETVTGKAGYEFDRG